MNRIRLPLGLASLLPLIGAFFVSTSAVSGADFVISWGSLVPASIPPAALTNISAITPNLALKTDRTVVAWGGNAFGERNVPAGLGNVIAIAQGYAHRLALRGDGTVVAWGAGTNNSGNIWTYSHGQSMVPAGLNNVVAIAAGWRHSLAVRANGTVVGWGFDYYGQTSVPPTLTNVIAVAAGMRADFSVALRADGTVVAWGYNGLGESDVPAGLTNAVAIAAGDHHGLALRSDGRVVAWGQNDWGQADVPAGLSNVVRIAAGWSHSIALRADGTVAVWGNTNYGLGAIPLGLTNVTLIAAGDTHNLAVNNGSPVLRSLPQDVFLHSFSNMNHSVVAFSVTAAGLPVPGYQWQRSGTNISGATNRWLIFRDCLQPEHSGDYRVVVYNSHGEVVSPEAHLEVSHSPPVLHEGPESRTVSPGWDIGFRANASGSLPWNIQWRLNGTNIPGANGLSLDFTNVHLADAGEYDVVITNIFGAATSDPALLTVLPSAVRVWGDNSRHQKHVPPGLTNVLSIAAGDSHCLALRSDGTVTAWGEIPSNSLGGFIAAWVPPDLSNVVAIASGPEHCLALTRQGTVVAWGNNSAGQGNVPSGLSNVVAVAGGRSFSLALKTDGRITAWGMDPGVTLIPANLTNAVAIAAASFRGMALTANGTVALWGGPSAIPAGLSNVVAIAAGYSHFMALKDDGSVVAWGTSYQGMGTPVDPPEGLGDVVAISAGGEYWGDHSLALRRNGTVVAWGNNSDGQTNVPFEPASVAAIAAGARHSLALDARYAIPSQAIPQNLALSNIVFSLALPTRSGRVYAMEYKNSIADDDWLPLPLAAGTGGVRWLTDGTATNDFRFYRIREW